MADLDEARERVARWSAFEGPLLGVWAVVATGTDVPVGSVMTRRSR